MFCLVPVKGREPVFTQVCISRYHSYQTLREIELNHHSIHWKSWPNTFKSQLTNY